MKYSEHFHFCFPDEAICSRWISTREGETRLGQQVLFRDATDSWTSRRYHILGITEDIGPRANGGLGGADKAFFAFIQRFMAVQSNRYLKGDTIAIHGYMVPSGVTSEMSLQDLVNELDRIVSDWTESVVKAGGIPIVIGGGHNNAYGLIKGTSQALQQPLSVINLDPHADTRDPEGRHSGNPFTYAWQEKWLKHYTVLGLHESYNNEAILRRLEEMHAHTVFLETWIDDPSKFHKDVAAAAEHLEDVPLGIELDLDSMAFMPSSAYTPSGITVEQARYYIRKLAASKQVCYLHLPEGAPKTDREEAIVGKTLAYLVTDFIKCHSGV